MRIPSRRWFLALCLCLLATASVSFGASFVVTSKADFITGNVQLNQVIASTTEGLDADYLRIRNYNPGIDDGVPANRFTNGGARTWNKRRALVLEVPIDGTGRANRINEKVLVEIDRIGGAKSDWADLRLTDSTGAPVNFGLIDFETPVDNPESPVKLLFEANANGGAGSATYWVYYGNEDATSMVTDTISRFYLSNHDFENGLASWSECLALFNNLNPLSADRPQTRNTTLYVNIEDGLSIVPDGFVGFNSKSCLSVGYPNGLSLGGDNRWRAVNQRVIGPATGSYILKAFRKSVSLSFTPAFWHLLFLQNPTVGCYWDAYFIAAGVTDWMPVSVEFSTPATRTVDCGVGFFVSESVANNGWRERRGNIDWVNLDLKYPLKPNLATETTAGYAPLASYVSRVFDTGVTSPVYSLLTYEGNTTAPGTGITMYTRTGNGVATSPWEMVDNSRIVSPNARYIQFAAALTSNDTAYTPILDAVQIYYDLPTTQLHVTAPASVNAGDYFEFSVSALDGLSAVDKLFTGTVTFTSTTGNATFPVVSYTFTTSDEGTHRFLARNQTAETFRIQATSGAISSQSLNITSIGAHADHLAVLGVPPTITAGSGFTLGIQVQDLYGNRVIGDNAILTLTCTDPYPASFPTTVTLSDGQATLTNFLVYTVSTQTLTIKDAARGFTAVATFSLVAGPVNKLKLSGTGDPYQGVPFPLKISAVDQYGNPVSTYNNPGLTLGISSGTITPAAGAIVNGSTTFNVTLSSPGNLTLSASTPTPLSGTLGVTVHPMSPAGLDHFAVDCGYVQRVGVPFTLLIEARDAYDNIVTGYQGACRLSASIGSATPAITSGYSFLDGILAIPVSLSAASPAIDVTVKDVADPGIIGGIQVQVLPGGIDHFDVLASSPVIAGASCSFHVTARDSGNNLLTGYTGTISLTHDAVGDTALPNIYTFQLSDQGKHVFSGLDAARFSKAGTFRIRIEDSGRIGFSNSIRVDPDMTGIKVSIQPEDYTVKLGKSFTSAVALEDRFGNPLTGFTGSVNLSYPGSAAPTGPLSYTFKSFENGSHRFLEQVLPTQLGTFSVQAIEPVSGAIASCPEIQVISGETLNFNMSPASVTIFAGETISFNVTASDSAGNLNQNYVGSIRFIATDPLALIPPDSALTLGQGAFSSTFYSTGRYMYSVRDTTNPAIVGSMTVTVLASIPSQLEVDIQDTDLIATAGETITVHFKIKDFFGNPASTTGSLVMRCTDTNPVSSPTPATQNLAVATSLYPRTWTLASAGVQFITASLTHPLGTIRETFSKPFLVTANIPASITGNLPANVSSELPVPFVIRVVDAYGNPTPLFTEGIRATSPVPAAQFTTEQYYYSPEDKGEYTFILRWAANPVDTGNQFTTTVSFGHLRITTPPANALATLTRSVYVDNPRDNAPAPQLPFMTLLLMQPDQDPIASIPFQMNLFSLSIRETPATITSWIDFSANNGDFLVSTDGVNYSKSLFMNNQSTVTFSAILSRSGYITVTAKNRNEPTKTGTTTFVSLPNSLDSLTLTADSPQKAGSRFPVKTEWWDLCRNYAELVQTTVDFTASAAGAFTFDPNSILTGGRKGVFDPTANSVWFDTTFTASASATNISNNLTLNTISLFPVYDNDFRYGIYNTPWRTWQTLTMNGNGPNTGQIRFDNALYIECLGNGYMIQSDNNNQNNVNDGYFYLYFDWPAWDTFDLDASIFIRRLLYAPVQIWNNYSLGLMVRDDSDAARPRYFCPQLHNISNANADNMGCIAESVYRYNTGARTYRQYITGAVSQSLITHPKWIRMVKTTANNPDWAGYVSPDGQIWRLFGSGTTAAADQPNITWGNFTKMGIAACAGSNAQPGGGWVTEFRINRYTATGSFISTVYDIGTMPASLGPVAMTATFTGGAAIAFDLKTSNSPAAFGDLVNGWTNIAVNALGGNNFSVTIPAGMRNRYLQYRLRLSAPELAAGRGIAAVTPVIYDINVPYTITNALGVTFAQRDWVDLEGSSVAPAANYSLPIEIKGGLVATLAITVPASTTAGAPLTLSVKAGDGAGGGFGNVADDATGTWRFTTSDGEPFSGTVPGDYTLVPAADKGQRTFYNSSILRSGVYQTITVTDGTRIATSAPILVNPGPINSFLASATTPQSASTSFPLYMEALDPFLNRKTDYFGLIQFFDTHTGGQSTYNPTQYPAASWSAGCATLTPGIAFTKAEKLKVIVQGDNRTGTSNEIEIQGATATSLLLAVTTNQPEAGVPFGLTLTALDAFGNVAVGYQGTVAFNCTDIASGVKLPATYTFFVADKGIRTWPASLTMITPGPVTITARDTLIASMTKSYPVTVLPGPVSRFEITCANPITAGVPFNIVITAYDAFGNKKTNFTEPVTLTSTFTSILPTTVSGFSNGELLIPSAEVDHAGALPAIGLIRVSFGGSASGTIPISLYPSASSFDRFDLEAIPASPTAGDAFKLVIKAVGANGAVYTNYAGIGTFLTASNTSGVQVAPPMIPTSATGFTGGLKEVYARIWEAGKITIWANDQTIPGKVGSLTLTIEPTNLSYYTVVPGTSTVEPYPNVYYQIVNGTFPLYLTAFDSIGNLKTNYTGTVEISTTGTGTLNATQAVFVAGQATVSSALYDWPGQMQIKIRDPILDKDGASNNISFFGPIASISILCNTSQTDEAAFLTKVTAFDSYGQVKLNTLASLTTQVVNWTLAPLSMSLTPVFLNPITWDKGVAYPILTANRDDAGANVGTLTLRLFASSTPTASGAAIVNVSRKAIAGPFHHFLIETFSPQKSGIPFSMLVKAVDANNVVVTTWASNSLLLASDTFGFGGTLSPTAIPAGSFISGVFSTTNATLEPPGTYTVTAFSDAFAGSFTPLLILPGNVSQLKITVPNYAPLNTAFTMSVAGLESNGLVKADYIPDGPILLSLNATATGFLGIQYIFPTAFVNGVGTLTVQTYNKSQLIWIKATDQGAGISDTGGPISVYGAPAKIFIEPQSSPLYWNNFFQVKITVKDINGFIVPDYDGTIHFSALPGTAPTATSPYVVASWTDQYFASVNGGITVMPLKVGYATESLPTSIFIKLVAEDLFRGLTKTTGDLEIICDPSNPLFDHWEITEPLPGQKRQKKVKFGFKVQAVSNFGTPMIVTTAPTVVSSVIDSSVTITNFNASPTGLIFTAEAATTTQAIADYTEAATATVRWTVDPFGIGVASVAVDLILEESRLRTELIKVQPNTRYILSLYAKTRDRTLATGTGAIEISCYAPSDPASYTHLATLNGGGGFAGIVAKTSGEHDWQRYSWWFETAVDTASIAIRLSADVGVVYFDALMLEPATRPNQTEPTVYSPHPVGIIHTASDSTIDISGERYYWQW